MQIDWTFWGLLAVFIAAEIWCRNDRKIIEAESKGEGRRKRQ